MSTQNEPRPAVEKSRPIYLAACAAIAAGLQESAGFTYAKSGPHARKYADDFTFQISFQSSTRNSAAAHVAVWIHAYVFSPKIQRWRAGFPILRPWNFIAGGQIGNLTRPAAWLEWDFSRAENRAAAAHSAITVIETLAFPFFASFENLAALEQQLSAEDMPAFTAQGMLEFLLCFASQNSAHLAGTNYLRRNPALVPAYRQYCAQYSLSGLDQRVQSGSAEQLAFASLAYGLGDLSEDRQS